MNLVLLLWKIGTDKLLYIARGYVKIAKAPKLCYADTINWNRIGNNTFLHLQQLKEDCPPCPERCNGYCWNQFKCQIFSDNCHPECLGCTRNHSNAHCEVCKNYEDNGICVAECPPAKYILQSMNSCLTKEECNQRNINKSKKDANKNWWVHENECRSDCPIGTEYSTQNNTCVYCENRCVKYCTANELNNQNAIQNLYGCTHINGSLVINGLKTSVDLNSLYENLRLIRVIEGYLLISRNDIIEDFDFLPNLTTIQGRELASGKAMFVYENRNLQRLWNFDGNFSLQILNGRIGFHDNEQLCLTEIQKFANKTGINYTDTDVSTNSNGAYCVTLTAKDMVINIVQINTTNATLVWERQNPDEEVYYTIYYSSSENNTESRKTDFCSSNGWDTISTANNSAQLLNLKVFTTYYFYIRIYLTNTQSVQTVIKNFTTLPDDPDPPSSFTAYPIDHESIKLVWTKPLSVNGLLNNYSINIYLEEDFSGMVYQRNYCQHPHSTKGSEPDKNEDYVITMKEELPAKLKMYDLETKEKTYPEAPCRPTNEEINIKLGENMWLYLCDKNSQSKFGFDNCRNYYYDRFNHSDIQIQKRSDERTSSRKKSSLEFPKANTFTITAPPDVTNTTIKNLKQFSVYVFYLIACNKEVDHRKLCSPVLQASARTLKRPMADDISDDVHITINQYDVIVSWSPPRRPNSFIVSYNIVYRKDLEHSQNTSVCIPQEVYRREKRHVLKNMLPGNYYLTVQAVSLAGPGNFTEKKYFEIASPATNTFWLIFFAVLLLVLGIVAILIFIRIKRRRIIERMELIRDVNPDYAYFGEEWEMKRNDIELQKVAGQGSFGIVHVGLIKSRNVICAVKTIKETATIQERLSFLKEASIMKEFSNGHHVVKLFGVVSRGQPPLVVMELMERGDLKQYLRSLRDSSQNFTSNEIYRMAIEIADGLAYLSSKKFVHRDVAARNCMVGTDRTVKIGDFGMTRDIYETDYYKKGTRGMLPVRWMPPEAIADGVFTSDTDIWSYGIVLWEIATLAEQPYQGLANEQVLQYVVSKGTLTRPAECPNLLWDIMRRCWDWYPNNRPTGFEIVEKLQTHVGQDFNLVSYYHSREGQEFLITHGSVRVNNPPALGTGPFQREEVSSENDPLNDDDGDHLNEPEFLPPSSPQQGSRLSGHFH